SNSGKTSRTTNPNRIKISSSRTSKSSPTKSRIQHSRSSKNSKTNQTSNSSSKPPINLRSKKRTLNHRHLINRPTRPPLNRKRIQKTRTANLPRPTPPAK